MRLLFVVVCCSLLLLFFFLFVVIETEITYHNLGLLTRREPSLIVRPRSAWPRQTKLLTWQ